MNKACSFYTCLIAIAFLGAAIIMPVSADQLYKWVDERGRVTYQSSPPPENAKSVEQSDIRSPAADDAVAETTEASETTTETAEATDTAEKETVPVTFFSSEECDACGDFRAYLEENEIAYEEIDISENSDMAAAMQEKYGHNTVPTVEVGNKSITGDDVGALATLLKNSGFENLTE